MATLDDLEREIGRAMLIDRHRLRQKLRAITAAGPPDPKRIDRWRQELTRSAETCSRRGEARPLVRYDEELPVCQRRTEIAAAIAANQVVIVCGETGSGKSTQLPKICLEMGRGVAGMIGHTQPRRIAARSVAARVAEELGVPLGSAVGFKIRFTDSTSDKTLVKLMTDGILLAETQSDRFLEQYDTLIIDEAHERSLNIDFLLGFIKRVLPRRPELKLIITSATIDPARFAEHFGGRRNPAPVVEVTGRTYPVEVRYRPPEADEEGGEADLERAIQAAVDELARIDSGDILLFMPTEHDIHEAVKSLQGRSWPGDPMGRETEILPLYARLPMSQQQRIFQPHKQRRIVIATNVAESSLTVPGIRYVVDPGTARISRYSARSKTQRLPIEPISQASADQRKGRCGRLGPGVCIRLYSQADYDARERYTPPEIQRTNLASVILQTKALRLGDIERFPFLEPPRPTAIRDGYKTLFELQAIDAHNNLTELGRRLARLPVDPRIGRMIVAADHESCLTEMLIIASALEVRDPRDRPADKQADADAAHAQFAHAESDFMAYLNLWDFYHALKEKLSKGQLRKACHTNFLSYNRMREWLDVHRQLLEIVEEAGLMRGPRRDEYPAIHRAILAGLLSNISQRGEAHDYNTAGGGKANVWPGSAVFSKKPKWIVAAEVVETSRRYLRTCAKIDPDWVEPLAGHLVKRTHSEPHWDRNHGSVVAYEKVLLFGLAVVPRRRVNYGPIDPVRARQLFIQHALVEGEFNTKADFLGHNLRLGERMQRMQVKLRRHDLLLGQWAQYDFYDLRLPDGIYDAVSFEQWRREAERQDRWVLRMTPNDFVREEIDPTVEESFPDTWKAGQVELPLEYRFEPGSECDGLTLRVPVEAFWQVDPERIGWLVPGLLEQKVTALIRSLPKHIRRNLVPAPDTAKKVVRELQYGEGSLLDHVARALSRLGGQHVVAGDFDEKKLPADLRMNIAVVGAEGATLADGRDVGEIRRQLGGEATVDVTAAADPRWSREGITSWDFGELPEKIEIRRAGLVLDAYPALVDRHDSVALRLFNARDRAIRETRRGLRRLFFLAARRELMKQVDWLPNLNAMLLYSRSAAEVDLKRQLAELLADRALAGLVEEPQNADEFSDFVRRGRDRIALAVQDVVAVMNPLWHDYHRAKLALEKARNPLWIHAVEDVRQQMAQLISPDFIGTTPWQWLEQYPRYLQAIDVRLERLGAGSLPRDLSGTAELQYFWDLYVRRAAEHRAADIDDPELVRYRWMIEEYRVSLFAQKLGTAVPVSSKRLEQQFLKVASG